MKGYVREGRYYRRRDGEVVGPARVGKMTSFPWKIGPHSYTNHGTFFMVGGQQSPFDLVEEVDARAPLVSGRAPLPIVEGASYRLDSGAVTGRLVSKKGGEGHGEWRSIAPGGMEGSWSTSFLEAHAIEIVETPETLRVSSSADLDKHVAESAVPAPPPFRLKEGKKYIARRGDVIGPMREEPTRYGVWRFVAEIDGVLNAWREDGTRDLTIGRENPLDLVAEYGEPEEAADAAVERMAREAGEPAIVIENLPPGDEDAEALRDALRAANKRIDELTALIEQAAEPERPDPDPRDAIGLLQVALGLMHSLRVDLSVLDRAGGCTGGIEASADFETACRMKDFAPDYAAASGLIKRAQKSRDPLPAGSTIRVGDRSITYGSGIEPWDLYAAHALGGFAAHLAGVSRKGGESLSEADARGAAARADALMAERAKRGIGK